MASSRKRARLGDILEVSTPRGLAYVQYVGKHPEYGAAIRVLPGFFQSRPTDWNALLAQEGYFTFYPVGAAVAQQVVEVAANQPIPPGRELPTRFRREGWTTPEGRVTTWFICDGEQETRKESLSAEDLKLFIASGWNHAYLVDRIVEEWRPEQDDGSPRPKAAPAQFEPPAKVQDEGPRRVQHYLYFKKKDAAQAVEAELKQRGFETEFRLSADGKNWLVLATHTLASDDALPEAREALEQLAEQHSGEYDGWEMAIGA